MFMDHQIVLKNFTLKEVLTLNSTQKRIVVLGTINDHEGEAILIISATTPTEPPYTFQQVKQIFHNDIYSRFDTLVANKYQIQSIFPVTQKHKDKYRAKTMLLLQQTAKQYIETKQQLLKHELSHISWVSNIIEGKAQTERVLHRCSQFILLPDFKFSDLNQVENLHLLCIFTDQKLCSLRDLTGQHIDLLKNAEQAIEKILLQRFKMQKGSYRLYFHYPPTFYRLHLHITNLKVQALTALSDRAHLLQHVINNLQISCSYYQQSTLMKMVQKK